MQKTITGRELRDLAILLLAAATLAIVAVGMLQGKGYIAITGVCALIALASFATGSMIGFIFGLPRVFSDDAKAALASANSKRRTKSNANLERVSDWLTTMIVGVALTQLLNIGKGLGAFQDFLRALAVNCDEQTVCHSNALVVAGPIILVGAAVVGFLFMYLYTRLVLTPVFDRIEDGLEPAAASFFLAQEGKDAPSPGQPVSVDEAMRVMFSALYEEAPRGFERAISAGAVLSNTAAARRADYWFYLACAFGQKLSFLRGQAEGLQDLTPDEQSALDNALDAAARAVAIDPAYKGRLRSVAARGGQDDDLLHVAQAAAFQKIVGGR